MLKSWLYRQPFLCWMMILLGTTTACRGQLLIIQKASEVDLSCIHVNCSAGYICQKGTCVVQTFEQPCNAIYQQGNCLTTEQCILGLCYDSSQSNLLAACDANHTNGFCQKEQICQQGNCLAIDSNQACAVSEPNGLCQSGAICIQGVCYSDLNLGCSSDSNHLNGFCPIGQSCQNGRCLDFKGSCSSNNFSGTCSTWQRCAEGHCVGPIPPDTLMCNANQPTGLCPFKELCIAGSCTPITNDNSCDANHFSGLCPLGGSCVNGRCLALNSSNQCSSSNTSGHCGAGAICLAGSCQWEACNIGGFQCDAGQICFQQNCVFVPCDPAHPAGLCLDHTKSCLLGECLPASCSLADPNGLCENGLVCSAGQCQLPPCSISSPLGPCDSEDLVCIQGNCLLKSCSPKALNGSCQGLAYTLDPNYGEIPLASTCCNTSLSQQTGCNLGICSAPACSATYPHGACPRPSTQYCSNGQCITAPCSSHFLNGSCPDGMHCIASKGRCSKLGCLGQNSNYCAPDICDTSSTSQTYGICIQPPCSLDPNHGYCSSGTACCNPALSAIDPLCDPNMAASNPNGSYVAFGSCYEPSCSTTFPGGFCPNQTICQGGQCISPICSNHYPSGNCGKNYTCSYNQKLNQSSCARSPCNPNAPLGYCSTGNRCVADSNKLHFGSCQIYTCSDDFPNGPCPLGTVCNSNHSCVQPLCSASAPSGLCLDNNGVVSNDLICNLGSCITPVCSPTHTQGFCPNHQICCDSVLQNSRSCTMGSCVWSACSTENNSGYCPGSLVCCSNTLIQSGFCSQRGQCLSKSCSLAFPTSACSDGNKTCSYGQCVIPCSPNHPLGQCPNTFACVNGSCSLACLNDQDCDTISDADEGRSQSIITNPNQGSPDYLNRDSDGDGIPDVVEAAGPGRTSISQAPYASYNNAIADFRNLDSDGDGIPDSYEVGASPSTPRDTDNDGVPDFRDRDSDGDGILDRCEATDFYGPCQHSKVGLLDPNNPNDIIDTNHNGKPDHLDLDSDSDGIPDAIEARLWPNIPGSLNPNGVDHDLDGVPDYRDLDSDNDGVIDADEDVNGDGIVNCQQDSNGFYIEDPRSSPTCNQSSFPFSAAMPYNYNPGCTSQKCLLAETSRVIADTDDNGIADANDAIYLTCSSSHLKAINIFYNQYADYAIAMETEYNQSNNVLRNTNNTGMIFDDSNQLHGSYSVATFILSKTPASSVMTSSQSNLQKALQQSSFDTSLLATAYQVKQVNLVINRNFTSFDGFASVVSQFSITTSQSVSVAQLRNRLLASLDSSLNSNLYLNGSSPTDTVFTFYLQTIYRYDDGISQGRVVSIGSLLPTGTNSNSLYTLNYRSNCSSQTTSNSCQNRPGCLYQNNSCIDDVNYQLPLFYATNSTSGSTVSQYGTDLKALCESMAQNTGLLDFLWIIDNSVSMAPKIGQVAAASGAFFDLLSQTEADYRVGLITTSPSLQAGTPQVQRNWKPTFPGCLAIDNPADCESNTGSAGCSWSSNSNSCLPRCTPYKDANSCMLSGCSWNNSDANASFCSFQGCSSLTSYFTNSNNFCSNGNPNQSSCLARGCSYSNNNCLAPYSCQAISNQSNCLNVSNCQWNASTNRCYAQNNNNQYICNYFGCSWNNSAKTCNLESLSERSNGALSGRFTGAIAGIINPQATDRTTRYSCSEGCSFTSCQGLASNVCTSYAECLLDSNNNCVSNCCSACFSSGAFEDPNNPACYFAARLPDDNGSGYEFGLLMAQWAMYRSGLHATCSSASDSTSCGNIAGCVWIGPNGKASSSSCIAAFCDSMLSSDQCNGHYPQASSYAFTSSPYPQKISSVVNTLNYPYGSTLVSNRTASASCAWDSSINQCLPSIDQPCGNFSSSNTCISYSPRCSWDSPSSSCVQTPLLGDVLCSGSTYETCIAQSPGWCQWDDCTAYTSESSCQAIYGCAFNGSSCLPIAYGGTCRPPLDKALRANASQIVVILSDEEECYLKDGDSGVYPGDYSSGVSPKYDGQCQWLQYGGGIMNYNDTIRQKRTQSYLEHFQSHGVLAFALTGDAANPCNAPGPRAAYVNQSTPVLNSCPSGCIWSGGNPFNPNDYSNAILNARCVDATNHNNLCPSANGGCYSIQSSGRLVQAEAGQGYIDVAQGTGGGWGSICASNLYPSIEAILLASLYKASPYQLYGFINAQAVQPIAATLKVSAQVCLIASEYPTCNSGTQIINVPRSRSNGFDYDSVSNTLVFFGSARAFTYGNIVVSYRYWTSSEPKTASSGSNLSCPCADSIDSSCHCADGLRCGISGSYSSNPTNYCSLHNSSATACNQISGCRWNSANGGSCMVTGICAIDPTCNGSCSEGYLCDSSSGLCLCDTACSSGCLAGSKCDNNNDIHPCNGLAPSSCNQINGCSYNSNVGRCYSTTCGQCVCDTTCGLRCGPGEVCDSNLASLTCGQCVCDTTCGGNCGSNLVCNSNTISLNCGFCLPPSCSNCRTGTLCDPSTGTCVCDTTCQSSCGTGQVCNSNLLSSTCGECICDTTCGGSCPVGSLCNSNTASLTCGLCEIDPSCGGQSCQQSCTASTQQSCLAMTDCRWTTALSTQGNCLPVACRTCNSSTGLCAGDPTCCGGCDTGQLCNTSSGSCQCDPTCGGSCAIGHLCDSNTSSSTCGQCLCDTTCDGSCPTGTICNNNITTSNCGSCIVDSTCGGGCNFPLVCDPSTGLCGPDPYCGGCPTQFICNSLTGQCQPIGG